MQAEDDNKSDLYYSFLYDTFVIMTTFLVSQAHLFRVRKNAFIDAHSMHVNFFRNTNNEIIDGRPITQGD